MSPPAAWHQQRVSGPHGFAVRNERRSSCAPIDRSRETRPAIFLRTDAAASTASPPAFRDDRDTPLVPGKDGRAGSSDLPDGLGGIFFARGLDEVLGDLPVGLFHGHGHRTISKGALAPIAISA